MQLAFVWVPGWPQKPSLYPPREVPAFPRCLSAADQVQDDDLPSSPDPCQQGIGIVILQPLMSAALGRQVGLSEFEAKVIYKGSSRLSHRETLS